MEKTVSAIVSNSGSALRVVSVGAQVAGTLTGNPKLVVAGTAAQAVGQFLAAVDGGAGATTTDSAATAIGQRSNAPNQEDLTSAPAPQLAETTDPVPETRPEVPETEFQAGIQNRFNDPLGSPDSLLNEILNAFQNVEEMDWDPQEIEEMMEGIENQILNVRRFLIGGSAEKPIQLTQKTKKIKLGKFVPV